MGRHKSKHTGVCKFCGRPAPDNMQGFCQACYRYFIIEKKKLYSIYSGPIQYNEDGDAICPICGMAYRKLGGHLKQKHGVTAAEQYRIWGLNPRTVKASNAAYRLHMKNVQDPKTISENLIKKGINTRIKPGQVFWRKEV